MRSLFLFVIISVLISCSRKETFPASIIKPETMELIMWDFIKADVFSEEFTKRNQPGTDTMANIKMQKLIFDHYKITKEQFYKSYQYYYSHPDLMNALLDSITANQNRIKVFEQN